MKILELVIALSKYSSDTEIVLSRDSEGNGFAPLHEVTSGLYVADNAWSGDVYGLNEPHLAGKDAKKVIVLYPSN